jgi:hypothetical protein
MTINGRASHTIQIISQHIYRHKHLLMIQLKAQLRKQIFIDIFDAYKVCDYKYVSIALPNGIKRNTNQN